MGVNALAYVTFDMADPAYWRNLYTRVLGMQLIERADGVIDVRCDEMHHRITLYPTGTDALRTVGWQLPNAEALDDLVARLRARGLDVTEGSAELCAERRVYRLYRFREPFLDVETELVLGQHSDRYAFVATRGIAGYRTGPLGLGHVVFHTHDVEGAVAFYREVMGFGLSDYMGWADAAAVFLHCNPRHHTLAIMNLCMGRKSGHFNHIMFEALDYDDIGYAYDVARDDRHPLIMDLGKHTNDHVHSFYIRTPGDYGVEYGWGGRLVGPDWQVCFYDQPMLYGHRTTTS
jgi:2,3-dihydroxybiphenyl 1,2-dioxygenase